MRFAKAFAPAHITGFFQICDRVKDFRKIGSRGAGVCLSKGAVTHVEVEKYRAGKIEIFVNNKRSRAEVTRKVAEELAGNQNVNVRIKTALYFPISQGLGMSAAGALSTALALNDALELKLEFKEVVEAAHKAEIACRTGLGDVIAQSIGGFEIRERPGLSPLGTIKRLNWDAGSKIVICVIGKEISTKSILTNVNWRRSINVCGMRLIEKLAQKPTVANFFELSYDFACSTKLATQNIIRAIEKARNYGLAAQAMLGNTVFAVGNTKKLVDTLKQFGTVYISTIGTRAKLLT